MATKELLKKMKEKLEQSTKQIDIIAERIVKRGENGGQIVKTWEGSLKPLCEYKSFLERHIPEYEKKVAAELAKESKPINVVEPPTEPKGIDKLNQIRAKFTEITGRKMANNIKLVDAQKILDDEIELARMEAEENMNE